MVLQKKVHSLITQPTYTLDSPCSSDSCHKGSLLPYSQRLHPKTATQVESLGQDNTDTFVQSENTYYTCIFPGSLPNYTHAFPGSFPDYTCAFPGSFPDYTCAFPGSSDYVTERLEEEPGNEATCTRYYIQFQNDGSLVGTYVYKILLSSRFLV